MIIGVTGLFAAGKDTFAEYLQQKGYRHLSLSDILRRHLRELGVEITIANLTRVGNELRQASGHGVLAERALAEMNPGESYVVSSIRHPSEVEALRKARSGFRLAFIDAPIEQRFARSQARGRKGDEVTLEAFRKAEERQMKGGDPAAQQLAACREMADFVINNEGTTEDFHRKIEEMLAGL